MQSLFYSPLTIFELEDAEFLNSQLLAEIAGIREDSPGLDRRTGEAGTWMTIFSRAPNPVVRLCVPMSWRRFKPAPRMSHQILISLATEFRLRAGLMCLDVSALIPP